MTMTLWLHPAGTFSWSSFSVHPSTVIGIPALGALYAWRARAGEVDPVPQPGAAPPSAPDPTRRPTHGQVLAFVLAWRRCSYRSTARCTI